MVEADRCDDARQLIRYEIRGIEPSAEPGLQYYHVRCLFFEDQHRHEEEILKKRRNEELCAQGIRLFKRPYKSFLGTHPAV